MSARTRKDVVLWGALGCALVSTAHAEYTLATASHFNEYVALAVPGALDLYVIRALQYRRDVFVAVLAMVAANVTSHLIAAQMLPVGWPVISAVGAIAPLIVWRVYALKHTRNRSELLWGTPALADTVEANAPVSEPECIPSAVYPDTVPEWMHDEYPASAPPLLHSVPALPPEYVSSAEPLTAADMEYLDAAREYREFVGGECSVRGLMRHANVGQKRAGKLLDYLETEDKA